MSGEKFNNVGQMLEKMQEFVEQTETSLQSSRDKVEHLREQYQSLKQKGSDLHQSLSSLKDQAEESLPETDLAAAVEEIATDAETKLDSRVLKPQPRNESLEVTSVKHESTNRSYLRK